MTLRTILGAEVIRARRDRGLHLSTLALALACTLATVVGLGRFRDDVRMSAHLIADEHMRYDSLATALSRGGFRKGAYDDWSNPQMVALTVGARAAILPAPPLSVLVVGQRPYLPTMMSVSTWRKPFDSRFQPLENGWHLAIGSLDFAFIIVAVLPLFIIALGFDVVSGDRELGTLGLLVAQRTPIAMVVAARMFVRLAVLVAVVSVGAILAMALARVPLGEAVVALLGISGLTLAYGACWCGLLVAIQCLRRSSLTNAFLALGGWTAFVVLLPPLLQAVVEARTPLPSRVELLTTARDIEERATDGADGALVAFYDQHPRLTAEAALASQRKYALAHLATLDGVDDLEKAFDDVFVERYVGLTRAAYVAPPALAHHLLQRLARTDAGRHHAFLTRVRQLNRRYGEYFYDLMLRNVTLTPEALSNVPRLDAPEALTPGTPGIAPGVSALCLLAVVLFGSGVLGLRRQLRAGRLQ